MSTIYVVGTPIGNLGDISSRAIDILGSVNTVFAEDTRVTRKLFSHFGIQSRLISYNENNASSKTNTVIQELENGDIAITTDAGTPLISDPGSALMKAIDQSGHKIVSVPGPSAVTAAISMSPFQIDRFAFLGFVPRQKSDMEKILIQYDSLGIPLVFFDSPHRIKTFLRHLSAINPDRRIMIAREMTKLHEERYVGTVAAALTHFEKPIGEFTLILESETFNGSEISQGTISNRIIDLARSGWSARDISIEIASNYGLSKRNAYKITLEQLKTSTSTEA